MKTTRRFRAAVCAATAAAGILSATGTAAAAPAPSAPPLPVNDVADGGWWEWGLYGKNTQKLAQTIGEGIWNAADAMGDAFDPLNQSLANGLSKLRGYDDGCTRKYPNRDGNYCYNDDGDGIPARGR